MYVVLGGAPRKILYHNDLTLFRVGNFISKRLRDYVLTKFFQDDTLGARIAR